MLELLTQWLKDFWIFISTPGTKMPTQTTVIVLVVVVASSFLLPSFVQWLTYRRRNPMEDPREKFKENAAKKSAKSGSKKKKKKK